MHKQTAHGIVDHRSDRKTDFLYRVSIKGLIKNKQGEVLVVKEAGRTTWDLPGGGIDHDEKIKNALARELKEEVNLTGDFTYTIIAVEEPALIDSHMIWQLRLIYKVAPENFSFKTGDDGDETIFLDPIKLKDSECEVERRIYKYSQL